ncbi:hypothetical protein BDZ94DRAFT_1276187 [Collybia nuda]|uniref:Uncharacterized protein n=1 Tax=Collybia nuda TaxID=64659 RepID=A0A9P6CBN6_9AGAR|nr:hypothetical protein BDZ94DRAFT_1276187 [Collybia nuda]
MPAVRRPLRDCMCIVGYCAANAGRNLERVPELRAVLLRALYPCRDAVLRGDMAVIRLGGEIILRHLVRNSNHEARLWVMIMITITIMVFFDCGSRVGVESRIRTLEVGVAFIYRMPRMWPTMRREVKDRSRAGKAVRWSTIKATRPKRAFMPA